MKTERLLFFALETILLTIAALLAAAIIFHRTIDQSIVASITIDLFMVSFLGLLFWWAACRTKHPRLGRVGVISPIVTTSLLDSLRALGDSAYITRTTLLTPTLLEIIGERPGRL
jgi:hypothetical protein